MSLPLGLSPLKLFPGTYLLKQLTHIRIYIYIHIYVCVYICVCVCVCVCIYIYIYILLPQDGVQSRAFVLEPENI